MAGLKEVQALAVSLMQEHGLPGWRFGFDKTKNRLGYCQYAKKRISVSAYFVLLNDIERVKKTILHEIAHALVGPAHRHDWIWRMKSREIGGTTSSSSPAELPKGKIEIRCPNHGIIGYRHRWTKNMTNSSFLCKRCRSVVSFHKNKE